MSSGCACARMHTRAHTRTRVHTHTHMRVSRISSSMRMHAAKLAGGRASATDAAVRADGSVGWLLAEMWPAGLQGAPSQPASRLPAMVRCVQKDAEAHEPPG